MLLNASRGELNSGPPNSQLRWSLLVPHRERLVRIARRRLPSLADAEDCVHEALVRAAAFPT
nr:sigma factor [Micromonospora sp. DSM 115978]